MLHPVLVGGSKWPFTEDFLTVVVRICEYNFVCVCVCLDSCLLGCYAMLTTDEGNGRLRTQ